MAKRLHTHEERFAARVAVGSPEQCWLWEGPVHPITGYPQFWPHGRAGGKVYAHRYSYERWIGPLDRGEQLDHTCHTNDLHCVPGVCVHRRCVNPWHLEPVSGSVNQRRRAGWTQDADGSWRCGKGHLAEGDGLTRAGACRECFNEYKREWRARNVLMGRHLDHGPEPERSVDEKTTRLLTDHPELAGEVDRFSPRTLQTMIRAGWSYRDGRWYGPGE